MVHNNTINAAGLADKDLAATLELTMAMQVAVTIKNLLDRAALDAAEVILKELFLQRAIKNHQKYNG